MFTKAIEEDHKRADTSELDLRGNDPGTDDFDDLHLDYKALAEQEAKADQGEEIIPCIFFPFHKQIIA